MANARKLWALKTSLKPISNTEGRPDIIAPPGWSFYSPQGTGDDEVIAYTGGKYTQYDPSGYLYAEKTDFYDGAKYGFSVNYGELAWLDFTDYFRGTKSEVDLDEGKPNFEAQITRGDPFSSEGYTGHFGSEIPSYFARFFTGGYITPLLYDNTNWTLLNTNNQFPSNFGGYTNTWASPIYYDIWYRNFKVSGGKNLVSDDYPEMSVFSSTLPGARRLASMQYIVTFATDTPGNWNEYDGATLEVMPTIPYEDKFFYSGTISNADKLALSQVGRPQLNGFTSYTESGSFIGAGTNIAYEVELALHRWGMRNDLNFDGNDPASYVAGDFFYSAVGDKSRGHNIIVPCWVNMNIRVGNAPEEGPVSRNGHNKRYVLVSIALETPYNAATFIPGSGIVLDTERGSATLFQPNEVSGYNYGQMGVTGASNTDFEQGPNNNWKRANFTDVVLNENLTTESTSYYDHVNCFRFNENGQEWFWTGGDKQAAGKTGSAYPTNRSIFRAEPPLAINNNYTSSKLNHAFLAGSLANGYQTAAQYVANWAGTIKEITPTDQPAVNWYSNVPWDTSANTTSTGRVDYNSSAVSGWRIQAFQWSNDGRFLYILFTSGPVANSGSNRAFQWVERYWCKDPAGYKLYEDPSEGSSSAENHLLWAGTTEVYFIDADATKTSDYIYPATSINVTPDGLYLQVLFDYFQEGYPTISEHLIGGNDKAMWSRDYSGIGSSLSNRLRMSTAPEMPMYWNLSPALYGQLQDQIYYYGIFWPTVKIYPGKIGDNLSVSDVDNGTTDIYLKLGYTYYSIYNQEYGFYDNYEDIGYEVKTYPTDFAWDANGTTLYLFGFLHHDLYQDQAPGCLGIHSFWNVSDGSPVMWKVDLHINRQRFYASPTAWPQRFPGVSTIDDSYFQGYTHLYNNRIYWAKVWHDEKRTQTSQALEATGASYTPWKRGGSFGAMQSSINLKIRKEHFSFTNQTEYTVTESYRTTYKQFLTQGYQSGLSVDTMCFAKSTIDNWTDTITRTRGGIRTLYRFDLSDASMAGDGFQIQDTSGNPITNSYVTYVGTPGTTGAYCDLYLSPTVTWPSAIRIRSTTDANIGCTITIRDIPKFHWCTLPLAPDSGLSNDGIVWYECPARSQQSSSQPSTWARSTHRQHAVFNLSKNGRHINALCSNRESGQGDGTNGKVQRITTWDMDTYAYINENTTSSLGSTEFIGVLDSPTDVAPPLVNSGGNSWGNGIHASMSYGNYTNVSDTPFIPVVRDRTYDANKSYSKINSKDEMSYLFSDYSYGLHHWTFSIDNQDTVDQADFDFQDDYAGLAGNNFIHWPYITSTNEEPTRTSAFWDRRGAFRGLWFVQTLPEPEYYNQGLRQSGLWLYGRPYFYTYWRYRPGRIPYTVNYYKEFSEHIPGFNDGSIEGQGFLMDSSETLIGQGSITSQVDYNENLKNFKLLNATFLESNWQAGQSFERCDVPKYFFRERGMPRDKQSSNVTPQGSYMGGASVLAWLDKWQMSNGRIQYNVLKKEFDTPNLTSIGYNWLEGGRVELEIPSTFDVHWHLDPTVEQEAVFNVALNYGAQIQVRSVRYLDNGRKLSVLASGELQTIGGTNFGGPAFAVLLYDLNDPYNLDGATFDKAYAYSGAINNTSAGIYYGSWWQSFERSAGTYYGGDMYWHPDGDKFWVIGIESNQTNFRTFPYLCRTLLYEFTLGTAWDLSTVSTNGFATYSNIAHDGSNFELPCNLEVTPDGNEVWWSLFTPYSNISGIRTFKSTLPSAWDVKNPSQSSQTNFTYQGYQAVKTRSGLQVTAADGAGQRIRYPSDSLERWYRTAYVDDTVETADYPAPDPDKAGSVLTNAEVSRGQPFGGCSIYEVKNKTQKPGSSVTVGNMGIFPTRPFRTRGLAFQTFAKGAREAVNQQDIFIWAVDPSESMMAITDGQRWIYQLAFNNDPKQR